MSTNLQKIPVKITWHSDVWSTSYSDWSDASLDILKTMDSKQFLVFIYNCFLMKKTQWNLSNGLKSVMEFCSSTTLKKVRRSIANVTLANWCVWRTKSVRNGSEWRRKKCSFTKTMRRVTSHSLTWRNWMNRAWNCFRTHHIQRIWPPATTTYLQTSRKYSEERDSTPTRKSSSKRTLISRPKINRSTRKVLKS